jgi:ATP-dependent RNA helicase SUPV3L1/SUV3
VVAFSAEAVYAIAELIRRQRGGAAVVMGSLSPRTRNAQVELFQSGEVDFLVATDAIGMGLNMDLDHVAFAGLRKFDGRRTRWLHAQEIGQIAGRAGRYRRDGTFGVTGECAEMDPDWVAAVEGHVFAAVTAAEWRNSRLDFHSLAALMRSLAAPAPSPGLKLSEESQDETTLRQLSVEEIVTRRSRDRANLIRLWEVCQTPDFRKSTQDEHTRLVGAMFEHLTQGNRRLPEDWAQAQFAGLDRTDGDIDTLSARLARVRTLAYVANRADWLVDPESWQGRTRALEDRLSDTLHQQLMQRFIDRRTSTLLRSLSHGAGPVLAGIGRDGAVTVEGHFVGRLAGLGFEPARGASALENRALRGAIERVVAPEIARRLGELAAEEDGAFALDSGGRVLWRGEAVGELAGGGPFAPRVRLHGEIGAATTRERAVRRLESFVADEAHRGLFALARLKSAVADGRLRGLARGLAYQLVEQFGVLDRREVETHVEGLGRPLWRLQPLSACANGAGGPSDRRRLRRTSSARLAGGPRPLDGLAAASAATPGARSARSARDWRPGRACRGAGAARRADSRGAAGGRRLATARGGLDRARLGARLGRADPARARFRARAKGRRGGTRPLASPGASGGGLAGASGRSSTGGAGPRKTSPPAPPERGLVRNPA